MKDLRYILFKFIYLIPPIQMLLLVLISAIELTTNYRFSDEIIARYGVLLGSSWSTLLVYIALFYNPKLNYCLFTKMMVIALIINQVLYELYPFIGNEIYDKCYTLSSFTVSIICYWSLLYKNKTK
jgi:hypothetical protein